MQYLAFSAIAAGLREKDHRFDFAQMRRKTFCLIFGIWRRIYSCLIFESQGWSCYRKHCELKRAGLTRKLEIRSCFRCRGGCVTVRYWASLLRIVLGCQVSIYLVSETIQTHINGDEIWTQTYLIQSFCENIKTLNTQKWREEPRQFSQERKVREEKESDKGKLLEN